MQKDKKPEPPVVKKLKSEKPDVRREGICDIANMATDKEQLEQLVEHGIPLHVGRLLTDPDEKIAAAAAGALRNMLIGSDTSGGDVFGHLLGPANVMVLVDSVCNTLESRWNESGSTNKFADMASEMLQFLALLLSKEQAATNFIEDPKRVEFLLSCLARPANVPFYAAHCLLILSEENPEWQRSADSFGSLTERLSDSTPVPLRVACSGILLNLKPEAETLQLAMPCLLEGLKLQPRESSHKVLELMKAEGTNPDAFEETKHEWLIATKTLTTCCEIFANIIPTPEDAMEEEEGLDEASLAERQEEAFVQSKVGLLLLENPVALATRVCDKVDEILNPKDEGRSNAAFMQDSDMDGTFNAAQSALLALLIDLVLVTPCSYFADRMDHLWRALSSVFDLYSKLPDKSWMQNQGGLLLYCMWVLLSKDNRQGTPNIALTEEHAKALYALCAATIGDEALLGIRSRVVDLLGCVAQRVSDPGLNHAIGGLLLQHIRSADPAVVAAALNALIDLYSDEKFDNVVKDLRLIPALRAFEKAFENLVHKYGCSEDSDEEVLGKLAMLADNLPGFIQYKRDHGC